MKKQFSPFVIILAVIFLLPACDTLFGDDDEPDNELISNYYNNTKNMVVTMQMFLQKAQLWENAQHDTLTVEEIEALNNEYIEAGEAFVATLNTAVEYQNNGAKYSFYDAVHKKPPDCKAMDYLPDTGTGVSPGLAKSVGDLIAKTKGDVAKIQQQYDSGKIDEETYRQAMKQITKNNLIKTANTGLGALVGTGAAVVTGLAIGTVSLPVILICTGVGVVVGTTVTYVANWYAGVNKSSSSEIVHYMVSGVTTVGNPIPAALLAEGCNMTFIIDGYAPVTIPNMQFPEDGYQKTIEIKPVSLADAQLGGTTEVCFYEEEIEGTLCTDVQFVSGIPNPVDPAPFQGVTVTGTILPPIEGCNMHFSIVGTDGYAKEENHTSDAEGKAYFYIPGGAEGVVDLITITTENGKTYTVTYAF